MVTVPGHNCESRARAEQHDGRSIDGSGFSAPVQDHSVRGNGPGPFSLDSVGDSLVEVGEPTGRLEV